MADTKISALTELAEQPAAGDLVPIVDVSDTSMAASGTDKKNTYLNLMGGAWTHFTPSWSGLTIGNATNDGYYIKLGKTVIFRVIMVWGNSTSATGNLLLTLPVASVSMGGTANILPIGITKAYHQATSQISDGTLVWSSTTTAYPEIWNVGSTYTAPSLITSIVPFTWVTPDEVQITGTYEAA